MTEELKNAIQDHQLGMLEQAEPIYRQILAKFPDHPDALHFLGLLLHQQGHSEEGARLIRKAIKRSPGYVDAHNNLGNVLKESGKPEKAEQCYLRAIQLDPENAEAHNNLCVVWSLQKRHQEAIAAGQKSVAFNPESPGGWLNLSRALQRGDMIEDSISACLRALDLDPEMIEAHLQLGQALYRMENTPGIPAATVKKRVRAYQQWLENNPGNPTSTFMLAVLSGDESMPRAPDDFIKRQFDRFAGSFDQTLANLDYRVPELIRMRLKQHKLPLAELEILDAGCGTGLCSPFLKPLAAQLIGVDLSPGMLDLARRRNQYDELIEAELTGFLQQSPQAFDLIVCSDTLCYFGDLSAILDATSAALKPGGLFIFSVEHLKPERPAGFRINSSGRYSHCKPYVLAQLGKSGLESESCREEVLRKERGEKVHGMIIEARSLGSE